MKKNIYSIIILVLFLVLGNFAAAQTPAVHGLSLEASSSNFSTNDDLTADYTTSGTVATAVTWYAHYQPLMVLNLPFEAGSVDPDNALLDYSGSGNDLSTSGDSDTEPVWGASVGHGGTGAFTFDGNDYLLAGEILPLNSDYTKCAWVYITSEFGYRNIMSGDLNAEQNHGFKVNPDGRLNAGHSFGAYYVIDTDSLHNDVWYFCAVTFDYESGLMTLYKDGIVVDQDIVPASNRSVIDPTVLVGSKVYNYYWHGNIDDAKIYDRELSQEQILSLYNNGDDIIVSQETHGDERWRVHVTPFSASSIGTERNTGNELVQAAEVSGVSLTASSPASLTTDDLTASFSSNPSVVETATAWYRDGNPDALLYMPFDGGPEDALLDFSGSDNHASKVGDIFHDPTWDATAGHNGSGAFDFDGDDYLDAGVVLPLSSSYTKTAWVYSTVYGFNNILSSVLHGENNHFLKMNADGRLNAGHSFGISTVLDPTPMALNAWYFVAVTFDVTTGEMILYKDGVPVNSGTVPAAYWEIADGSVLVGAMNNTFNWDGNIDEARVFDRVLSPEQIAAMNSGDNVMLAEETLGGEDWYAEIIPFSTSEAGTSVASNTVTVYSVVVSDIPDQSISEGSSFTAFDLDNYVTVYEFTEADLVWTSTGSTELIVSIDVTTHVATVAVPDANWYGSEDITFTATNPNGASDGTEVNFTVQNVNDAPVVTASSGQSTAEDTNLTGLTVEFTDLDPTDTHTITVVSSNPNVSMANLSGSTNLSTYDLVPVEHWNGTTTITVTVTDNGSGNLSDQDIFTLEVTEVNDPPELTEIGAQAVAEDNSAIGLSVVFTDPDDDLHTITVVSNESNVVVENLNGNISGSTYNLVPVADWSGSAQIVVTVTDDGTGNLTDVETYTLTVNPSNDAPVLSEAGDQSTQEDVILQVAVTFVDVDPTDSHSITVVSDEANVIVGTVSGTISGSTYDLAPALDWTGTAQITVTVTDDGTGALSDTETYTLTVHATNDAPVISEIGNQVVDEGNSLTGLIVTFTDSDALDTHIITVVSSDANVTVANLSGDVSESTYDLVPAADWSGSAQITVRVTDNGPGTLSDSETYTFTVNNINDAPVLIEVGDQSTPEDVTLQMAVTFVDVDPTDSHTITVVSDEANVSVGTVSGTTSGSTYDLVPASDWNGYAQITVSLADNGTGALTDSEIYTLRVGPVNDDPTAIELSNTDVDEFSPLGTVVGLLTSIDADIQDEHEYELVSGDDDDDNASFTIEGDALQTNSQIRYEVQDTYLIRVQTRDSYGATWSQSFEISVNNVYETSVDEIEDTRTLSVYPVPAIDYVNVEIDNPENRELILEIYSNAGRLVHAEPIYSKAIIDLTGYSDGMYYLRIKGEQVYGTRKIIVKDR